MKTFRLEQLWATVVCAPPSPKPERRPDTATSYALPASSLPFGVIFSFAVILSLFPVHQAVAQSASPRLIQHVARIPNVGNPELLYWFINPEELPQDAYTKDLNLVVANGTFDFLFLTQRDGADFYDYSLMHPILKDLVSRAHAKGLKVGLQLWPTEKNIPIDQTQGIVDEKELPLDSNGYADSTAHATGARTHGDPPQFNAPAVKSELLRVFAFKKTGDGTYTPGSVIDITDRAAAKSSDALSVSIVINASPALAGYTAYILTAHYHQYPDMFSPFMQDSFHEALRQYGDVRFDGAALDEFRYLPLALAQIFRGRVYSPAMANYFKQHTGGDLVTTLFDMRYSPLGDPVPRIRAINNYFELLRQGPLNIEKLFAQWTTEIFGPTAFHGIHGTFHNALDNDEIWATGINWWSIPRDYGQTDENTPMTTRLGIGMAHAKPVEYNQFYTSNGPDFFQEGINDARYNVRIHYHAIDDTRSVGTDLRDPAILAGIAAVENKVRLLNQFDAPRPATNVLYLFGFPALANWYPDASQRNDWDINGSLKAEEKAVAAWNAGYRGPFAPSYLIEDGKIAGDSKGGILYGGQRFTALVFIGPEYSKDSTLKLLESFVAGGGKLLLEGRATRNFNGKDIADRMRKLSSRAVATSFDLNAMARLGVPKLALADGARYEDGSVVLTDLNSLTSNTPKPFSVSVEGHTFTGTYIGLIAIKSDREGHLLKLAAGGLQNLQCDGKAIVTLSEPADIVLTRNAAGQYTGLVKGRAEVTGP